VPANQAVIESYDLGYECPDTWIGFASYWHLGAPNIEKGCKEYVGGVRFESPMLTKAAISEHSFGYDPIFSYQNTITPWPSYQSELTPTC